MQWYKIKVTVRCPVLNVHHNGWQDNTQSQTKLSWHGRVWLGPQGPSASISSCKWPLWPQDLFETGHNTLMKNMKSQKIVYYTWTLTQNWTEPFQCSSSTRTTLHAVARQFLTVLRFVRNLTLTVYPAITPWTIIELRKLVFEINAYTNFLPHYSMT